MATMFPLKQCPHSTWCFSLWFSTFQAQERGSQQPSSFEKKGLQKLLFQVRELVGCPVAPLLSILAVSLAFWCFILLFRESSSFWFYFGAGLFRRLKTQRSINLPKGKMSVKETPMQKVFFSFPCRVDYSATTAMATKQEPHYIFFFSPANSVLGLYGFYLFYVKASKLNSSVSNSYFVRLIFYFQDVSTHI